MKSSVLSWIIISIAFIGSFAVYPYMPEQMAIHWNVSNEINGFAHKAFALLLLPALMVILIVVLPKKQNYQIHKPGIHIVQNVTLLCLLVLHSVTIAFGYGVSFNIAKVILPMVGILLAITGYHMPRFQPNSFIGIRTTHTLASESNWRKTHKSAAKYYLIGGLLMIAATFVPAPYHTILFFGIFVMVVLASVYLSFHFGKDSK
jgi:uncharacterized membrane protein